uniref:ATP-binding cassette sub-family B member 5 n=1 Tax=Geotrypetes seraphini TaxID=260995 RepID=A0A6P8PCU3_GEOSA|nr:ATP-dependent translocase ABCB1-like [Geotrypetes seraphini]XP_033786804.1 ATP-dependent translocase ABCB1-like [Geotrypetes seraphini]XP_033786805.1 ATP-dependent translocase ABCB1-like [Geotrypetes seraphini]XP_033786806.1 ATP-dependent translocase ABCB1-like [Geotrypetes seraphini]XP_033786807.1 ATP-dependent translocase ABCB1-like [Geotrypetes seraphini]XP_033786808.1 ATP-dependent translocase ABCB1-like [Geotrypetes seraphini]XP_033786809.1 ATP-dependent translocase ABCB1-like [Geotry
MKDDFTNYPGQDQVGVEFPANGYNNLAFTTDEKPSQNDMPKKNKKKKEKVNKEKAKLVGMLQLFAYADCLDKVLMTVGLICAVANGVALPLMIIVFGEMTDSFVQSGVQEYNSSANMSSECVGIPHMDIEGQMTRFAYYFVGIGFAVLVLSTIQVWTFLLAATRQTQRIRHNFFYAVLHQEMTWFDTNQIGTLNTRLTDDINTIHDGLGDKICIFIQFFSTFVAGIVIGFIYGWKLTLVIMSVSPLLALSAAVWSKLLATLTTAELTSYSKAGAVAEEVLTAIRTVVAFNGQQKAIAKYNVSLEEAKAVGVKKSLTTNISMGLTQFLIFGAYALGLWYGTKLTVEEPQNYTIGSVLIVFFSVLIGTFSIGQAAPNLEGIANARGAAYEVYRIIQKHRPIDSGCKDGHKPDKLTGQIEFKNIFFSYPSRPDITILQGLNLKVETGKTIALVGSSGCGKSTTIQLLQRFYDPMEGQVMLDGQDIRSLNVKWLREHIGVVSQEPVLFATTIAENIRYGREDVTDAEIEQASKEANAFDFISKLPDRFNTMVGERGAQLSGGQKQRIAIARALVRNPKILLLDEATSALDTQSESIVQAALDKARTGRTTIVIAHRLSTIKTADVIAGFRNGVIVELGTHSELMAQKGVYYSLVMQQNNASSNEYEETDEYTDHTEDEDQLDFEIIPDLPETEGIERTSIHRQSSRQKRRKSTMKKRRVKKTKKSKSDEKEDIEELPEVGLTRILALNKPEWPYIIFGVIAAAIAGGIYPTFAVIFGKVIGSFQETDGDKRSQNTNLLSLMFLVLGIISILVYIIMGYTFGKSGENLTMRLRSSSFKALLQQEIGWFDDHKNAVGVLLTRLATDASQVKGATGTRMGLIIMTICTLLAAIIIAFIYSWQLTLMILACVPFLTGANFIRMKSMAGHASKDQKALEEAGRISTEAVENIRTVVSLTREDTFYVKYTTSLDGPYRDAMIKAPLYGFTYGISQSCNYFVNAAVFRFGAWLIAHCYTGFENVFIVFSAIVFAAMSVGQSTSLAPDFGKAKVSAQRIFKLLSRKPLIDSYSEEGQKLNTFNGNIEFRNIQFVYPTRPEVQVLQGLSIGVNKGQTLALVGSSGCGKSTSIQLLERFYDPMEGHVVADGVDTKALNLQWLRSQLGIVSQEPILFDCSITENIQYGDNSRIVSKEEVEQAARAANIHTFIVNLPDGYSTRVGDKGTQLSGGQKQRIAIARALVRKPKVLLLDEATSALDTESEKIVQQALDNARQGRTCIVIAHRLSTVQNADIIAVIQNGRVVEQGTHNQLLARQGAYYALVNAQVSH